MQAAVEPQEQTSSDLSNDVTEEHLRGALAAWNDAAREGLAQRRDDVERLKAFGEAIDEVRKRIESQIGAEDVAYIKKVDRFSRLMEVVGRVLIHFGFDPLTFGAGVFCLWIYKQLQSTEVGHTALHGAFDGLEGAEKFHSKTFRWEPPIDEAAWHAGHNVGHHQYTNVYGKDPDCKYGPVRLNPQVPYDDAYEHQVVSALASWPLFGTAMNAHFTGVEEFWTINPSEWVVLKGKEKNWETFKESHTKAFRKYARHFLKEYVLFPALAGPFFWKVALGNFLSSRMRDIYSAATIYCGHIGEDVADYPESTRARGRGEWYAMQAEAANNFEVPLPISRLCGALDYQIEHHLFPKWPTNRLRQAAPEIRAICEKHGVNYNTDTWGGTLRKAFRRLAQLSKPQPGEETAAV